MKTELLYLGHAGFLLQHNGKRFGIDPWFYPAFLQSWFPSPDNRFLLDNVVGGPLDYLYISHCHEDHFDRRLLERVNKNVQVICPAYRSKTLLRRFRAMGFGSIATLGHKQSMALPDGLTVTMYLDTSHKEDSGLLIEFDGFRFLDLNDCNTTLSDLPTDIDLLAAQHSGAMWYPNCYDYPPQVMAEKVAQVRSDLMLTLVKKCEVTGARAYLPSAGPACFLDPSLRAYNDREKTIFPWWEDVKDRFQEKCHNVRVLEMNPGDKAELSPDPISVELNSATQNDSLDAYSERRRSEWEAFHTARSEPIRTNEIVSYLGKLQKRNRHLLHDFSKLIRLTADQQAWTIRLGEMAQDFVIEGEEPYDPQYSLIMPAHVLRLVLDDVVGWEEALLSMRVRLSRNPDVFDSRFLGLLRYGNEPVQTLQMVREGQRGGFVERDGLRFQKYCPHAGEDLNHAIINGNIIECPRHHWRWNIQTGACIEGGNLPLKIEQISQSTATERDAAEIQASGCSGCAAGAQESVSEPAR